MGGTRDPHDRDGALPDRPKDRDLRRIDPVACGHLLHLREERRDLHELSLRESEVAHGEGREMVRRAVPSREGALLEDHVGIVDDAVRPAMVDDRLLVVAQEAAMILHRPERQSLLGEQRLGLPDVVERDVRDADGRDPPRPEQRHGVAQILSQMRRHMDPEEIRALPSEPRHARLEGADEGAALVFFLRHVFRGEEDVLPPLHQLTEQRLTGAHAVDGGRVPA